MDISSDQKAKGWSQKYILSFLLLALFVSVYLLNSLFPLFGEDWDYSFKWTMDGQNPDRLETVSEIFVSQYNHYLTWGGRSVVHAIDQFLILIGDPWNDLINTLAYVCLVALVYWIVNYKNSLSLKVFLVVSFSLWFFLPNMPSLIVWLTYSSVYLWGTLISVLFMSPFIYFYRRPETHIGNVFLSVIMFLTGIIAGWTYENMALTLLCFLALLFIVMKVDKMKIPSWMFLGFLGALIGCALLILAPGNFKRASASSSDISMLYIILYRVWDLLKVYLNHIAILSVIYTVALCFFTKRSNRQDNEKIKLLSLILVVSAHFGILVMLVSPIFPARTLFGIVVLMIIAIGVLLANISFVGPKFEILKWGGIALIFIFFCFDYHYKYTYISYFSDFWKQRKVYVEEQKGQGIKNIVFPDYMIVNMDFIESTCEFKPFIEGWPNFSYAKYNELNSVRTK